MIAKVTLTANDEAYYDRAYPVSIDLTEQLMSMLHSGMPVLTDPEFTVDLLRNELIGQMNARFGREVFYGPLVAALGASVSAGSLPFSVSAGWRASVGSRRSGREPERLLPRSEHDVAPSPVLPYQLALSRTCIEATRRAEGVHHRQSDCRASPHFR